MSMAIETHQLTKQFGRRRGWRQLARQPPITAVSSVDLSVSKGEIFGLLGPNGAGKTTLVKMLCTLILPSSGSARVAGYSLSEAGAVRSAVGLVVSDERSFYWRLTARRNLTFFAALYGLQGHVANERIHEVLAQVNLLDEADKRFSDFSSGMRQRLAIARSLLHRPQILFLDEPSRSLDPTATRRLHALLQQLLAEQGVTIFLITHDLAEAEHLCEQVALMHRGKIRAIGRPAALRKQLRPFRYYTLTTPPLTDGDLAGLGAIASSLEHKSLGGRSQVRFRASEKDGVLTAVIDRLRRQGHAIEAVEGAPATLEEVFAHFTGEATGGEFG